MCKEYINIQTGEKLDLEKVASLPDNAMLKVKPEWWNIWDFEKNNELSYDIWKMTKSNGSKVWWIDECNHNYDMTVSKKAIGRKCTVCSGRRVDITNCLATLRPDLAKQWHLDKNNKTPYDFTCGSNANVWWKCEKGHEWEATIKHRKNGSNCPICSGRVVNIGLNDLETCYPEIAKEWHPTKNGELTPDKVCYGSSTIKVWWICELGHEWKSNINNRTNHGNSCPKCSCKISYPERIMSALLVSMNVEFDYDKKMKWSDNKKYDFYFEFNGEKIIIETHGKQHYEENARGRSLKEEQENDAYKYKLAVENGIDKYIVIDCRKSDLQWIKGNIIKSELKDFLNLENVDWSKIEIDASKNKILEISKLKNEGFSRKEIIEELMISTSSFYKYIKIAKELKLITS